MSDIEALTKENRKLSAKLEARDAELKKLRAENRELKLRPPPRTYVDADDEREANAWREKANNLLTLLDNLQHDMQDDLLNLEAETLQPGSSTLSTPAKGSSSTLVASTAKTAEPAAEPAEAASPAPRSGRKRKERSERTKSPEPLFAEPAAESAAAADADAADASLDALTKAYKDLGAAAKYIHQRYREVKDGVADNATAKNIWADNSDPIKHSAKAAKAVAGHRDEPIDFGSAPFADKTLEVTKAAKEWAESVRKIYSQAGDHASALKAGAKALHSSARKLGSAAADFNASDAASVELVTTHANAVAANLKTLMDAEADWLLSM
ncbi:uncharacterized protein AMSG_01675 [Thecamonas trahens ATCC 50062]|uniref:Uncharacterized protein n=1 Tax=Thecamonas trahens ATCC 50062 TaxID=461836 RepID=A0A0L0DRD8_THETB|nr:hypothetical protein AMSG_01675 [Thecamonas trahens ATCC 50062]KNC54822.1 hypothetical protein AMSG_01675 [Thecamonas trahens ATCC 50062]|eukprot:XP_013761721.1 hypothetical protein AMSG_01675 [Thecamonas trahens ATCC 50062]